MMRLHASALAICFVLPWQTRAHADAPIMGDWSGMAEVWATALLIGTVVPKYTLSIRPDDHFSGMQWSAPFEMHLGFTQAIVPSIAWYPGEGSAFLRGTYQVPIGLGSRGGLLPALVPGVGGFTSTHGSGPRAALQLWYGLMDRSGFHSRRIAGVFVGGAWERNLAREQTWWEISAGFEMPIPLDVLISGREW
jgi:hypothetical protein